MNGAFLRPSRSAGITYIEVMVAVVLVAISLVPAMTSLQTGMQASAVSAETRTQYYQLLGRMESVLAEPFGALESAMLAAGSPTTPSQYSDAPGPGSLMVYLSAYDIDNADADNDPFTGAEPDVLWVRTAIPGTRLRMETLSYRY